MHTTHNTHTHNISRLVSAFEDKVLCLSENAENDGKNKNAHIVDNFPDFVDFILDEAKGQEARKMFVVCSNFLDTLEKVTVKKVMGLICNLIFCHEFEKIMAFQ